MALKTWIAGHKNSENAEMRADFWGMQDIMKLNPKHIYIKFICYIYQFC